jgi:hypothetical protein
VHVRPTSRNRHHSRRRPTKVKFHRFCGCLRASDGPPKPLRPSLFDSLRRETKFSRLQIRTVAELLEGWGIDYPARTGANVTFKRAPRAEGPEHEQLVMQTRNIE